MSEEATVESPAGSTEPATTAPTETTTRQNRRQTKVGTVVSNKMTQTVIVAVEILVNDRLYHRRMKKTTKFAAHDELQCNIGDQVAIVSSRPLSRTKRWRVREILKRAK
ncbi:MAG TPA: 30S ribosomal protein S17 [Thermoanaerobaculia bacterium]|nr:30S ribosomal protein S17 [Thermoanaerobaculia bacterium]